MNWDSRGLPATYGDSLLYSRPPGHGRRTGSHRLFSQQARAQAHRLTTSVPPSTNMKDPTISRHSQLPTRFRRDCELDTLMISEPMSAFCGGGGEACVVRLTAIASCGVVDTAINHITANERVLRRRGPGADSVLTSGPMSALRGEVEGARLVWCG